MNPENDIPPVYSPNEPPRANSSIGQSQQAFLNNFTALYNAFEQNHVPLDAESGAGFHTILQMLSQSGQFQTNTGEISLYGREITLPAPSNDIINYQLFIREQGNQPEFPWTNFQIYVPSARIPGQIQYFTTLPGNLILYFGTVFPGASNNTITLRPPICVNIVGANLVPNQPKPAFIPRIEIETADKNGVIDYLSLKYLNFPMAAAYNYVIIGNIYDI